MHRRCRLALTCLLALACASISAEPQPADYLAISRATGKKLQRAGFDQADNLYWQSGLGDAYDPRTDAIAVHAPISEAADDPSITAIPLAQRAATIAAHEHCHAYLWKQRHRLTRAVRQAADTCNVLPQAIGGRTFDELFCDMAAVVMIGDPARQLFLALRKSEDPSEDAPGTPPDFSGHSYPLLKRAIEADGHESDPVLRTANAVTAACQTPAFQALRGVEETAMATRLTHALTGRMNWLTHPPKVTITPIARMSKTQRNRLKAVWRDVGESIPLAFSGAYEACRQQIAGEFPRSPYVRQTMAHCKLGRKQYAEAFCGALAIELAGEVAQNTTGYEREVTQVVQTLFGHHSLLAGLAQAEHDYALSVYAGGDVLQDIGARIEYACGRPPEIFRDLERVDRGRQE